MYNYFFLAGNSGEANIPQDTTADLRIDDTAEGCTIFLVWMPPYNLDVDDISYYNVYINGTNVINRTSNTDERLIVSSYRECSASCATNLIGVSAVNRCFREGEISNITLDQRSGSLLMSECERVSTVQPPDNCIHFIDQRDMCLGKCEPPVA